MIDYKELLKKYIRYVCGCEGTTFIDEYGPQPHGDFTPAEWAELLALDGDEVVPEVCDCEECEEQRRR